MAEVGLFACPKQLFWCLCIHKFLLTVFLNGAMLLQLFNPKLDSNFV